MFAKSGAIIPTQTDADDNKLGKKDKLTVYVFPGADNTFKLYEDSGDGNEYKKGDFVITEMNLDWKENADRVIRTNASNRTYTTAVLYFKDFKNDHYQTRCPETHQSKGRDI